MATAFAYAERARRAEARGQLRQAAALYARARRQFDQDVPTPDHLNAQGQLDSSWKSFWDGCATTCDNIADHQEAPRC